jgi:hypothetical protein
VVNGAIQLALDLRRTFKHVQNASDSQRAFSKALISVYYGNAFGQERLEQYIREFDPGSGRTLAARLTHASRAELRFRF